MMTRHSIQMAVIAASILGILAFSSCNTAPPSAEGKQHLRHTAEDALNQAMQTDASLREVIRTSAGYAVFPEIGKGAIGVGGAYGKGDVYQGGSVVGYCDMTQASIGLQLGGQAYSEILVFQTS